MADKDEIRKNPPATAEDDDFSEDEENTEEEDDGSLVVEEADEEGGDYYLHRIDRLLRADERDELPRLHADPLFSARSVIARSGIPVNLDEKEFGLRLRSFLKQENPNLPDVAPALVDFLFDRAVHAHKLIAVWHVIIKNAKRPDLDEARHYLQKELNRYVAIRLLVGEQREELPSWMQEWAYYWLGAFEQIEEEVESQLKSAKRALDNIAEKGTSTRIEMESFILWAEKNKIRDQIAETQFARSLEILLAAFAYAAKLIPEPDKGIDGYLDVIKQRASRISRSKEKRLEALGFYLTAMLEIPSPRTTQKER